MTRSRLDYLVAQYADLGALEQGEIREQVSGYVRRMHRASMRLPVGAGYVADDLLRALRAWNACYDRAGELRTGQDMADAAERQVAQQEARLLPLIANLDWRRWERG